MKTCANCGKEYEEHEQKCPVCGSTVLKYSKKNDADDEYQRIQNEILRKRRSRSIMLGAIAAAIVLVLIIAVSAIIRHANDPQRAIDKAAAEQFETAMGYIDSGDYDKALSALDAIDPSWSGYGKVDGAKATAVKAQLKEKLSSYEASGDYESVISYINENVENVDSDAELKKIYDDSVAKYKQAALTKADEYINAGDYSAAASVLTTAIRVIGSDNDLQSRLSTVQKQDILAQVQKLQADGDYASAIKLVNDNMDKVGNDSDILLVRSSCEDAYRKDITANAERAFQDSGYKEALSVVNNGLTVLRDDASLLDLKSYYENKAPVSLCDLDAFYCNYDSVSKKVGVTLQDKLGNTHENCIEYNYGYDESVDIYVLNREYSSFKGTLFVPKDRSVNSDNNNDKFFYFTIYGDDQLLYTSPLMKASQYPVDFEIDVTGVDQLKINWPGGAATWWLPIGLANPYLYK